MCDGLLFVVNQPSAAAAAYRVDDDDGFLLHQHRREIAPLSLPATRAPKYGKWNTCIV